MGLGHDLRIAARDARHRPVFALAVVLTLGIGIGASTAAFALVDRVLINPLPYPNADQVVGLWFKSPSFPGGLSRVRHNHATYLQWRDQSRVFESFALAEASTVTVDDGSRVSRVAASVVTPEIFTVLGISPAIGRPFTPEDAQPGAEPTMVLGHGMWQRDFASDTGIIGTIVTVDGSARRVIGVLPRTVRFPLDESQLWIPLEIDPVMASRTDFVYTGWGLTRAETDVAAVTRDFHYVLQTLPEAYPNFFTRPLLERFQFSAEVVPLEAELVGDSRQPLLIVMLAGFVVLLVVMGNVTNLFIVRSERRSREWAIRAAIGAGPGRLVRGLLTETVAYGIAGGAVGLMLGLLALRLAKSLGSGVIPRLHEVGLDPRGFLFMAVVSLGIGAVVGLVSAVRIRNTDLQHALRKGGKGTGSARGTLRIRWLLVAGQVAFALTLSVNAGLLVRSQAALTNVDPGFDTASVLGARLFLPEREYPAYEQVRQFYLDLVNDARDLPSVESAAAVSFLPLRDGRIFYSFRFPGETEDDTLPVARLTKIVSDGYFATMRIPLVEGRVFDRSDIEAGTDAVIVNREFARTHWPGQSALGQRFRYGGAPDDGEGFSWFTVVGVVGDVRDRDLTAPPGAMVYFPMQERHARLDERWRQMSLAVRTSSPQALAGLVGQAVAQRNRGLPVYDVRGMDEVIRAATARARYTMWLLVASAGGALFLAAIGLYGVLAYVVNERSREIGLRIALGARPAQVGRLVMRQAMVFVGIGTAAGAVLLAGTNRLVRNLLFGVEPVDAPTFAAVAVAMVLVCWLAARAPARRAATIAPAITLKEE